MVEQQPGLEAAWTDFARSGSVPAARRAISSIAPDVRRLLIVFATAFISTRLAGEDSAAALASATAIPDWIVDRIS
jgi:hypothetical protein